MSEPVHCSPFCSPQLLCANCLNRGFQNTYGRLAAKLLPGLEAARRAEGEGTRMSKHPDILDSRFSSVFEDFLTPAPRWPGLCFFCSGHGKVLREPWYWIASALQGTPLRHLAVRLEASQTRWMVRPCIFCTPDAELKAQAHSSSAPDKPTAPVSREDPAHD